MRAGGCLTGVASSVREDRPQARGVLGLIPGDYWLFHFPPFSLHLCVVCRF